MLKMNPVECVVVTAAHTFSFTLFLNRIKSVMEDSEVEKSSCEEDKARFGSLPLLTRTEFGDASVKNWTSLTSEVCN